MILPRRRVGVLLRLSLAGLLAGAGAAFAAGATAQVVFPTTWPTTSAA